MRRIAILIAISLLAANILISLTTAQDSLNSPVGTKKEEILLDKIPNDNIHNKIHINMIKSSDESQKVTYEIVIETRNLVSSDANYDKDHMVYNLGYQPSEVSLYYSVNDNVYICYDEIKTEFKLKDKDNYVLYEPDVNAFCSGNVIEGGIKELIGLIPYLNAFGVFQYASETAKCLPEYSWWCKNVIQYETSNQISEYSNCVPGPDIFKAIEGTTEVERNGRRIHSIQFTRTALVGGPLNPRDKVLAKVSAVRFTIPLKIKNLNKISDLRLWISSFDGQVSKCGVYLEDPQINKIKSTIDSGKNGVESGENVPEKYGQITAVNWTTKDTYDRSEPVPVKVDFKNTGSNPRSFWVGYSVQDSTGKWWDVPAQQTTAIQAGESGTLELQWQPPEVAPDGAYNTRVALWNEQNSTTGLMEGEFDSRTRENAFQLNPLQTKVIGGWDRTFDGSEDDWGNSVQQTSDGGYIITGSTGGTKIWLIKTDADGNKLWDKTFSGSEDDWGNSVQQTSDGGYIIAGSTTSQITGGSKVWLIKTDADGNKLWDKTFGESILKETYSVRQTSDGGYIIAGSTTSQPQRYSDTNTKVLLIKTDADGNKLWEKTFGGSEHDWGNSVQQTSDGGYIIVGNSNDGTFLLLIKTDADGNKLWDMTFGGSGSSWNSGNSIQQTSDGGYIIAGLTSSQYIGFGDIWLVKTDAEGNKLWDKTFGGGFKGNPIKDDSGYSVQQTSDGGYIIGSAGVMIKTDADGNKLWDKTFGRSDDYSWDNCRSVQQTNDDGYILVGTTSHYRASDWDVRLIKTDANGNV
jgi:hypothetical protein